MAPDRPCGQLPAAMDAPQLSPPRDLSHLFSVLVKNRPASAAKKLYKFFSIPGVGNLAGGLPHESLFPFDTLEAQVATPRRWTPTPNDPNAGSDEPTTSPATDPPLASRHLTVPKLADQTDPVKKIDLSTALQYGTAEGYPPLRSFVRQFTRNNLHPAVPYAGGPEIILTCGSTDGFSKFVELFVDPWIPGKDPVEERPGLLCEAFIYGNGPNTAMARGAQAVPVEVDSQGMKADGPGGLRDVLENWDPSRGRRPHIMYTVTMGHNPTGGILSVQRRRDIYALCSEFDVVIAEDDPYWYLQYPSAAAAEAKSRDLEPPEQAPVPRPTTSSGYEFLDSLVPSYLSIDTDGRVVRLDTFSKTIAPGCRLGWITAQPAMVERIARITETTTQNPSGFVQSMVAQLVMGHQTEQTRTFLSLSPRDKLTFEGWNTDGWVRWLAGLRGVYERRMNSMCTILDAGSYQLKQSTPVGSSAGLDPGWGVITKTRLMTFDWPRGGMFIWVRVHLESHPLFGATRRSGLPLDGPPMSMALMMYLTKKPFIVVAGPGSTFAADPRIAADRGWQYMRLCFAAEAAEKIEPCSHRFVDGVQRFFRVKDVDEIEKLLDELQSETTTLDIDGGVDNIGYPGIGC